MPGLKYLLDTHALVWAVRDDDRLSAKAARIIHATPLEQLGISDVTLQEIGYLIHVGRISFKGPVEATLAPFLDHMAILPVTLPIALAAPGLKFPHNDPFDRIIGTTARHHGVPLVTADGNITDSGVVETIW